MAEDFIQSVQKKMMEETVTRATLNNYSKKNMEELAAIIRQARDTGCVDEVLTASEEFLNKYKDNIVALYLKGILMLEKDSLENSALESLVSILLNNHKEALVEDLCTGILEDYPTNKFALLTKAELLKNRSSDEVWDLYKRIVKLDFSEADLAKALGEHYDSVKEHELAKEYYKKAVLRYINTDNYNSAKETWSRLVQLSPQDYDFFQLVRNKMAKKFGPQKTVNPMQELYVWYKDNKDWETAIEILKQNLEIEPKDTWARKEITDCYRGLYKNHSKLDDYIRSSNLEQSYRSVFEAINDFEKHIAFDNNRFVFHRSWGVGIITELKDDKLVVNFGGKNNAKEISLQMAISTLMPLADDHIWVLKAKYPREKLSVQVKEKPVWALKKIIKSFDNSCDLKKIKAELIPSILDTKEWAAWSSKAKEILENNPQFGVDPENPAKYILFGKNVTLEEKLSNKFKAQKQFFSRIDIMMKFYNDEDAQKSSDAFAEMFSYFTGYLKNITHVTEQEIAAYLVVTKISTEYKQLSFTTTETFESLYRRLEDPRETYLALKDTKNTSLRKDFIAAIRMVQNWKDEYIRLFPTVLQQDMLDELLKEHKEDVQRLVRTSFDAFKDNREAAVYFFKNCQDYDWYKEAGVPYEKQLIVLINILELGHRETINHVRSTENKKLEKTITSLLFLNDTLFNYMFSKDENTVKKLYTLIDDNPVIDPTNKSQTRNKILEKYPDFKFRVSEEKDAQPKGMLVTAKKLAEKRAEIESIKNVELEANKKELADAKAKGDLKENAEYQAAKERKQYLEHRLARLQEEMSRATIFDPTTSTTAIVSFATVVTLHNKDTDKDEEYTILGPWESDSNSIISYMSPLGNAILNKAVGSDAVFENNGHTYKYTIKSIKKAQI